jgi:hypothetical protein
MHNHRSLVACGVCFFVYLCYDFFQAEQQQHLPLSKILSGGVKHASKSIIVSRADDVKQERHKMSHNMSHSISRVDDAIGSHIDTIRGADMKESSHNMTMSRADDVKDASHNMSHTKKSHNIIMHTSGINADFERLIFEVAAQLVGELPPRVVPILHRDQLLRAVATSPDDLSKITKATTARPPKDSYHATHTLGLYRLAKVVSELEAGKKNHIHILVIGGSMTAGHEAGEYPGAWPRKLEILLQALWGPESVTVTNIARPGTGYNYWTRNFASIVEYGNFDIIIGDFAVNDQVDYADQDEKAMALNKTQYSLLNLLVHLPFHPATVLVETFRTSGADERDAHLHCKEHRKKVGTQWICPQWWMPQTWREQAVHFNSVPIVSYRDAVWPLRDDPPANLQYYWDGLSHPFFNAHVMVAEALLFQFLAVRRNAAFLSTYASSDFHVPNLPPAHDVCVNTTTKYLAENGSNDTSRFSGWNNPKDSHCWQYRTDSRDKYGWIAETSKESDRCTAAANHSALFQINMDVGENGIVILSYLASYDERMASARVWVVDESGKALSSNYTINSWHKEQTSIETSTILHVPRHNNFTTVNKFSTVNVQLLPGTSHASQKDSENGVDKFKLLGLMSC